MKLPIVLQGIDGKIPILTYARKSMMLESTSMTCFSKQITTDPGGGVLVLGQGSANIEKRLWLCL